MDFALMSGKKTSFEFGCTLCATLFAIICFQERHLSFFTEEELIMHFHCIFYKEPLFF